MSTLCDNTPATGIGEDPSLYPPHKPGEPMSRHDRALFFVLLNERRKFHESRLGVDECFRLGLPDDMVNSILQRVPKRAPETPPPSYFPTVVAGAAPAPPMFDETTPRTPPPEDEGLNTSIGGFSARKRTVSFTPMPPSMSPLERSAAIDAFSPTAMVPMTTMGTGPTASIASTPTPVRQPLQTTSVNTTNTSVSTPGSKASSLAMCERESSVASSNSGYSDFCENEPISVLESGVGGNGAVTDATPLRSMEIDVAPDTSVFVVPRAAGGGVRGTLRAACTTLRRGLATPKAMSVVCLLLVAAFAVTYHIALETQLLQAPRHVSRDVSTFFVPALAVADGMACLYLFHVFFQRNFRRIARRGNSRMAKHADDDGAPSGLRMFQRLWLAVAIPAGVKLVVVAVSMPSGSAMALPWQLALPFYALPFIVLAMQRALNRAPADNEETDPTEAPETPFNVWGHASVWHVVGILDLLQLSETACAVKALPHIGTHDAPLRNTVVVFALVLSAAILLPQLVFAAWRRGPGGATTRWPRAAIEAIALALRVAALVATGVNPGIMAVKNILCLAFLVAV